MNDKIKLLAEQAHEFAVSIYEKRLETEKAANVFFYKIKDTKFAELIVQECMKLNSKELSITAIERLLPLYEEHFGVEE